MRAIIYLMIAAILWGANFHFAKNMLKEVGFMEAGFWRYLLGILPLLVFAYRGLPSKEILLKNAKGILLVGILGLFGFNIFFFLGLKFSSAINGALIISTSPMLTVIFSNRILKTGLEGKHLLGVFFSFSGVLYLILKGNLFNLSQLDFSKGDLLLFLACSIFALQNVWIKKYGSGLSNINFTFFTNLLCGLSFLLVLPFIGMGHPTSYTNNFWFSSLGIGFFGTAIAYYLWNEGIKLSSANQAGIMLNIVPLSAAVISIVLGEKLYSYHLISGLLILISVIVIKR